MRLARAALAAIFGSLLLVGLLASPAAAHASLVAIDPADGARLDESPDVVRLTFSEPVSVGLGGVRVLDGEGEDVREGAARAEGEVVEVELQPDLPDGTYVVSYRVISADGHPVRGGSVFGVGDVEVDAGALGRVAGDAGDRTWDVIGAIGRGLAYAGVLVAAGGTAFLVLVHRGGDERARLVRLVRGAAVVGGLASLVALPVQAALGTGQGVGSLFDDGVLTEVAKDGVGLGVAFALVGLLVATVALERLPALALAGAALAAGSFATNGHTRAGPTVALATATDVSHLWVVAIWGGGLVLLARTLRARRAEADRSDTIVTVGRFSNVATASIVLVGVTGGVLAWNEVRTLDALTSTGYGRLLLVKVALVLWIAALGAYNHLRLVPALTKGRADAALSQLWTTLRLEVVTLAAVVAITSVLVVVTPARTEAAPGVVERIVELGDAGSVQLTVAPARAGSNQIHLYLFDPDGRPAEIAESITLVMSLPSADLGPITRDALRAGPAHFQLDGTDLAVAGDWTIDVKARVDRFTEATGTAEIPDRVVRPGMIGGMRVTVRTLLVAFGLVVLSAAPAAADAAGPSDFSSEVTGIVPAGDAVAAEIRGGDSFLEVRVDEGHTVIVEGYEGEPYLRFQPDGTVERNRLSTATYLNEDRQGEVDIPADARPDAEPEWEAIASGGTYAWHDHRVHWMQESSPSVARGESVGGAYDPWRVPIVVDGAPAEIEGTLVYEETVSPLPYVGLAVIVAGLLGFYGRAASLRLTTVLLAVVSAGAVLVGWADYSATPDGGGNPLHWALAAVALVAAIGAALLAGRTAGVILTLASAAALSGWGLFRIEVLFKPVLPTELPYALDRTVVALALGVSVGAAAVAVLSSGLTLPELTEDVLLGASDDEDGPTATRSS